MKKKKAALISLSIFIGAVLFFGGFSNVSAQQCFNCVEGVACPEGYVFSSDYTCPETNQICCILQEEQATCASLGGTCRSAALCDQNTNTTNSSTTGCGSGEVCCIPISQSGTSCSSVSGTCRASCESGETAQQGSYYDCIGSNITCCKSGSSTTPSTSPASSGSTATIEFPNPLKYDTVEEVLTSLLNALQGVIVVISIIFIVIGAIFYITSAGNDQRMETAKKAILASLIGLAIGIAAPTFLKEIYTILGAEDIPDEVSGAPTIATIALNTLNFLLSIVGTISLIMLIVAAIMYLTAAGDEDRIDKGKKLFKYALIGITIALASLVIVKQIAGFFS